jgi:rhodanese-related sulfurtransferase
MEIKSFIKTNRLFLTALILAFIVIIIIISVRAPSVSYKVSPDKVSTLLNDTGSLVTPFDLYNLVLKKSSNILVIDLRSAEQFDKGHIEKSINIPARNLLDENVLSIFRDLKKMNGIAILYGKDQLEANGPWLLLKQVGIDNVKVLQGGYSFYQRLPLPDSLVAGSAFQWNLEVPDADMKDFGKEATGVKTGVPSEVKNAKEKVTPVKKPATTGGGC